MTTFAEAGSDVGIQILRFMLAGVPTPGDWIERGRCRTVPLSVFFPERGEDLSQAQEICRLCPVREDCAGYAIPHGNLHGVWGGLSHVERQRIRLERHQARIDALVEPEPVERAVRSERGALDRTLLALTEHPSRWARVGHFASEGSAHAMASLLRTGRRPHPPGSWEFEGRRAEAGGSDLYARYLGPDGHEMTAS